MNASGEASSRVVSLFYAELSAQRRHLDDMSYRLLQFYVTVFAGALAAQQF